MVPAMTKNRSIEVEINSIRKEGLNAPLAL
jgi:hypothetical protein